MSLKRMRSMPVVAVALAAILLSAAPAVAYNEENVAQIQMQRLDPVSCSAPIDVTAVLTDSAGKPVPGAVVQFSYATSAAGDSIAPTTTSSDTDGVAQTTLDLSCISGSRTVRASVPGDGSAQIVVTCGPSDGCTTEPSGSTAPETATDITPPPGGTSGDDGLLRGLMALLLLVSIGAAGLLGWSRRRAHGRR